MRTWHRSDSSMPQTCSWSSVADKITPPPTPCPPQACKRGPSSPSSRRLPVSTSLRSRLRKRTTSKRWRWALRTLRTAPWTPLAWRKPWTFGKPWAGPRRSSPAWTRARTGLGRRSGFSCLTRGSSTCRPTSKGGGRRGSWVFRLTSTKFLSILRRSNWSRRRRCWRCTRCSRCCRSSLRMWLRWGDSSV